jgi:hypothetical protein
MFWDSKLFRFKKQKLLAPKLWIIWRRLATVLGNIKFVFIKIHMKKVFELFFYATIYRGEHLKMFGSIYESL